MKKAHSIDLRLVAAGLMVLAIAFGVFMPAEPVRSAPGPTSVTEGDSMPSLRGADAVRHLKASGQYDTLADAMKAVAERDGVSAIETSGGAFSLQKRVLASSPQFFSFFGESVAISGSTAVVGALNQTVDGREFQGAAYVFVRSGSNWVEQEVLIAADGAARDNFGYSVAIDGERVIIGAPGDNFPASDEGSAYVYLRSGTVWNQEVKLGAGDPNGGAQFGSSVAISGLTAAVGSNHPNGTMGRQGAVYVFTKGTIWTQQQKLVANDAATGDAFGFQRSVAISGETIIAGSRFATVGGNLLQGAAYIFTRSGSTWTQQQKLTAPDGNGYDEFGFSVAINGETAVVGAWQADFAGVIKGAAYVFVRSGVFWIFQQKLTASDGISGDRFARSVGIDGETVIVGSEPSVFLSSRPGSAYIFVRSGNDWTEEQKLFAPGVTFSNRFGSSAAIDGGIVIVGAVFDTVTVQDQGSAYIFGTPGSTAPPPEKIVFSSNRDGNDEIYVMNPDGSGQTRLTDNAASDLHPSFSGDTTRITFSSTRDGNSEIYIMNADGSDPVRLTNNAANDSQPSFSRDGLKIVFRSNRDGNDEIYTMNTTGGNVTRLTNNAVEDSEPSFSPAGNRILFERVEGGNRDLYTMNASDGGNLTRLTTVAAADFAANYSRNGLRIVFASARNGNNEIYSMNADGTGQQRLTNNSAADTEPFFSPDGTKIVFETDRDGNAELYSMNADGTIQSRLTTNSAADSAPDWGGIPSQSTAGRVTASDGLQADAFGSSVAISGNTAIIGAVWDDFGPNSAQGSAYIFVRVGGAWVEQQKIFAPDGADGDEFGWRVAVSGETAIVGAWKSDLPGGFIQGSAYIFVRNGTAWTLQQKITAPDAASNDMFGSSVAISGETVIVGAEQDDIGTNNNQGSAYVFVRSGTAWTLQQKLTVADGSAFDAFGGGIAMSGETAIIGASGDDVGANSNQGSAYVFVRNGTTWSQQQQLTAADGAAQDTFGYSLAISGETVIVASLFDDVGANVDQGSAYIFVRNGSVWTQQQKLTAADGAANDWLGWGVGISGETAIIGSPRSDVSATNQGAAYTFVRSGSTWTQLQKIVAPDAAANDEFGQAVGMSGETAVVGARLKAIGSNTQQGAAYFFPTVIPPPPTPTPSPTPVPTVQPNTAVGAPVTIRIFDASVTYPSVTQAGNTIFVPISPPGSAGTPPAGYVICPTCAAYDISTTAVYTGPLNVCLGVSPGISEAAFSGMILLHGEGGVLVDRTTGRFTNGDERTVCGSVTSFSPFVLAHLSGTPTPTPVGLEGDVAGRPNGDGSFASNDVVQMRRFASGLDTPAVAPNEFQRADSAPLASKGDGVISAADVVQARRFVAGLDAPGTAGGPSSPSASRLLTRDEDHLSENQPGREVALGEATFDTSTTVTLPIEITAYGDEVAVSFTIEYDRAILSDPRVVLGDAFAEGAVLTVNKTPHGRIGILIDSDLPMIPAKDVRRVAIVTFDVAADIKNTAVSLSDDVAVRGVLDSLGNLLPTRWHDRLLCEGFDGERGLCQEGAISVRPPVLSSILMSEMTMSFCTALHIS